MADKIKQVGDTPGTSEKAKTSQAQATIKTSELVKVSRNGDIKFQVELTDGTKGTVSRPHTKVLVDITNYLQDPQNLKAHYSPTSMEKVIKAYRRVNLLTPGQRKIVEKAELNRQAASSIAQKDMPSPGDAKDSLLKVEVTTEAKEIARISAAKTDAPVAKKPDENTGETSTELTFAIDESSAQAPKLETLDYSSKKPDEAEKEVRAIFTNKSDDYDKFTAFQYLLPNIRHVLNKPNLNIADVKQLYNNTKGTTQAAYNKLRDTLQLAVSKKLQNQKAITDPLTTFFKSEPGKEVLKKPGEIFMMTIAHLFAQSRKELVKTEHITGAVKIYLATAKALAEQIRAKKS